MVGERSPAERHNPLGKISVSKVVQKSSNRGAARLGILLGKRDSTNIHRHLVSVPRLDLVLGASERYTAHPSGGMV